MSLVYAPTFLDWLRKMITNLPWHCWTNAGPVMKIPKLKIRFSKWSKIKFSIEASRYTYHNWVFSNREWFRVGLELILEFYFGNFEMNITFLILASILCVGSFSKHRGKDQKKTVDEFLCADPICVYLLMLTILATQLGGGSVIGSGTPWGMDRYLTFGIALGLVLMAYTAGPALRKFGAMTVSQVIGDIYQSRWLQIISSLLF